MRMKKATAFGLAALMAATMIPAVPAMAKGDDSEGSVYYLNFKPEQADQWSDLAKKYTDETGVPVTVVTAASGTRIARSNGSFRSWRWRKELLPEF